MENINLSDIRIVERTELELDKLYALEHSFDSFEYQLNSSIDPIALDSRSGKPYQIINGRHRIYLARQKGIKSIKAKMV
jgi:hypothetical protein